MNRRRRVPGLAVAAIAVSLGPLGALAAPHLHASGSHAPTVKVQEATRRSPSPVHRAATPSKADPSFPDPHVEFSADTNVCDVCHASHVAGTSANLLNQTSQKLVCYSCHDGSGATSNIRTGPTGFGEATIGSSTLTSFHPVPRPVNGYSLTCGDCHTPHQPASQDTAALRVNVNGDYVYSPPGSPIGNAFCYGCHGTGSTYPAPFGDYSAFDSSVHNTSPKIAPPTSGSGVMCLTCHQSHGSQYTALLNASEPQLCFNCHTEAGATGPDPSSTSTPTSAVWQAFNSPTSPPNAYTPGAVRIYHHPVSEADQAGGTRTVECSSCHNSHLSQTSDANTVANPADTSQPFALVWSHGWDRGNVTAFCETCHVNPSDTQPVPTGAGVPYPINLVTDPHDTFTASYYNQTSFHGAGGANLACTACHDSHGSSNAFMLLGTVVSPDGSTTNTVTGYDGSAGEWQKLATFCSTCHALPADASHPQDSSQQSCLDCHKHAGGL